MKRYIIIVFILLLGQIAQSQGVSRFSFGLDFSPAYSYFIFSSDNEAVEKHVNNTGQPRFGYSLGTPIRLNINDRLSIESGIYWVKRGVRTDSMHDSIPWTHNNGNEAYLMRTDEKTNFHFFEIPINLRLVLYDFNKFELYLRTGFAVDFLIHLSENNHMYFTDDVYHFKGKVPRPYSSTRIVNYVVNGGLGINYKLTDRLTVKFSPYFSYMLNNLNANNPEDTENPNIHLYDISFMLGMNYKFQKKQHPTNMQSTLQRPLH